MSDTKETTKTAKKELPTPKAVASVEEYFADRQKNYKPGDLDFTRSWANSQLLKMEEDGFPVLTSVLNFDQAFSAFLIKEVLHNQEFEWVSKKYTLFVRNDRVLPTIEPTGAPLPVELHQKVIALKVGLAGSFNKPGDNGRNSQHQVTETQRTMATNVASALNAAKRRYKWEGNPVLIEEISKEGTKFNLVKAISLLTRYGCDVNSSIEEAKWLYEL
jgi:hypothetical protein